MNSLKFLCIALIVLSFGIGVFVFPFLPQTIPVHWNAQGFADAFGPSWSGVFVFPALMVFVFALFLVIPKIEVFKKNLLAFQKEYWVLAAVLEAFFLLFFLATLAPNFGFEFNMVFFITILIGFLFIAIGFLMPRFKRNFFVGIRTPWTLASDKVWKKTHEFGGKAFILAGIICLASLLIPAYSLMVSIAAALFAAAAAVIYSYLEFRKDKTIEL